MQYIRVLVSAIVLTLTAGPVLASSHPFALQVDTVNAAPGQRVEVAVRFNPAGAAASAIAFYVEYDATRLAFDPPAANATADPVFRSSYGMIEAGERSLIGVCIYDPDVPLASLASGPIAVLPFRVLETASGFAPVTIARGVDASDPFARRIDPSHASLAGGGITIVPPAPKFDPAEDHDRPLFAPRPGSSEVLIPAAPRIDAADGSMWRTAFALHNTSARDSRIEFTIAGATDDARIINLSAGETRILEDAVAEIFGLDAFRGSVVARSSDGALEIRATARHTSAEGVTTAQEIPAIPRAAFFQAGRPARLVGIVRDASARTTLTLLNRSERPETLTLRALRVDGTIAGSRSYNLAEGEVRAGVDIWSDLELEDDALTIEISATDRDARFYAYASIVDASGNALFQPAR